MILSLNLWPQFRFDGNDKAKLQIVMIIWFRLWHPNTMAILFLSCVYLSLVSFIWCCFNDKICAQHSFKKAPIDVQSSCNSTKAEKNIVHAQHLHYIVHSALLAMEFVYLFFSFLNSSVVRFFFVSLLFCPLNYYAFTFNNTFAMCCQATRH